MLTARLDGSTCIKDKMDVKLGYSTYKSRDENTNMEGTEVHNLEEKDYEQNTTQNDSEPSNSRSAVTNSTIIEQNITEQGHCRSTNHLKPPCQNFTETQRTFPSFGQYLRP